MNFFRVICIAALSLFGNLVAAEITVAAASDLRFAMDELVREFHAKQSTARVKATYGSSGNFFAQLQNRAPFDLYFSADIDYPRRLAADGLALDTNTFLYAIGHIVIWAPTSSPIDVRKLGVQSLLAPSVKKIAIANPQFAPYGRAAVAAMKSLKVYDAVQSRLVLGDNITQTAQFVQTGAADIGIIALSLALAPQMRASGQYWEVPPDAYPKMEQGGIILKWTKNAEAARSFRDFVLGESGGQVLSRYGFFLPPK